MSELQLKPERSRLSAAIRTLRKSRGLTQVTLAKALGVHQSAVAKWEGDIDKPTAKALMKLSELAPEPERQWWRNQAADQAGLPSEFFDGAQKALEMLQGADVDRRVREINIDKNQLPSSRPGWDSELLSVVIEALNKKLGVKTGAVSDREYAEKVVFYYELCHKMKSEDPAMVERFLKTA